MSSNWVSFGYRAECKKQKGTVAIENFKGRIRLRWRFRGERYSLSLFPYNKLNVSAAKKVALKIELDMLNDQFDATLVAYGKQTSLPEVKVQPKTIVEYFEKWTKDFKQLDCDINSDYHHLRNTLRKWGELDSRQMLIALNKENYSPKTFNERLSMLFHFSNWMVRQEYWKLNPFDGVSKRKVKRTQLPERKPFTENEISLILDAFRYDKVCPKSSSIKHSHYYPFMFFLFKTGVRNAEAVGLRVGHVDIKNKHIHIKEALARSVKGTHPTVRVRKETKNGKVRLLPFTDDLKAVLLPLLVNKAADDLVFLSPRGLSIDDRMFQRRIFKPVLHALNIPARVLYATRHTFGSRCIDQGITPVMTAFLMGNNPETALKRYTHQLNIPENLPAIGHD
jgi:integrase